MAESAISLAGYFVVQATLTNQSPLYLGAGEGLDTDKALSRSADGNTLIVQGSALGGCIRSWISDHYYAPTDEENIEAWNYFWGIETLDNAFQSHFKVKNVQVAIDKEKQVTIIDHVGINAATGTNTNRAKFDRQGLTAAIDIPLRIEVPIYSIGIYV